MLTKINDFLLLIFGYFYTITKNKKSIHNFKKMGDYKGILLLELSNILLIGDKELIINPL
jgi:hypothetical protein